MTIPVGTPWTEYVFGIGGEGEFYLNRPAKVGDTGRLAMNVNLFDGDTDEVIWADYKITQVVDGISNFYKAKVIKVYE